MGRSEKWLWREAAAKAAILAVVFQALLVSFCHLPTAKPGKGPGAGPAALSSQSFSGIICSATGARSAADAGSLTTLPSLFHRVPPPDHQGAWSCPACFVLLGAALAILTVFVLRLPVQARPLFSAPEGVWRHTCLVLHPHPTRGPPAAFLAV